MSRRFTTSRLSNIPGIGVDRMGNAADALGDPSILRLENLDTDIAPPAVAIEATQSAIPRDDNNSYLPFLGQKALREAVVKRMQGTSGQLYNWQKETIISAGGMSGILNVLLATIEPGDEVIVTDPVYAGIINRIHLCAGIPKFTPLIPSPSGWSLDIDKLKRAITSRTRMIAISPGMPTGHILTHTEWNAIAELCCQHDLWLLYDAAMERILYDQRPLLHPAALPGMRERTISIGAASKELRMIGWRIGWIVGPESIMQAIGLVSLTNVVCQTGIAMPGVAAALLTPDDGLKEANAVWEGRRNVLLEELRGLPAIPPHGGWSLLLNASAMGFSPTEMCERLLKRGQIAATPMTAWGEKVAPHYVRFVFSNESEERLRGMRQRIDRALDL